MDRDTKAKSIQKRMKQLEDGRSDYESLQKEVIKFILPQRYNYDRTQLKGQKYGTSVYDGTPTSALNLFADGLFGNLMNPAMRWFRLKLRKDFWRNKRISPTEKLDIQEWLDECEALMYSAFARSNIYEETPEFLRDGGSVGTATMYSEEDLERDRTVFCTRHPGECYISESKFGKVDTLYRKFKWPLHKIVERFGVDNLPETIRGLVEPNQDQEYEIIHATFPRGNIEVYFSDNGIRKQKRSNKFFPFESVYLLLDAAPSPHILSESGYKLFPYLVWRYRKNSDGGPYGESPGQDALIDMYALNQIGRSMLIGAQKSVEPALNVPEEMRGKVRLNPHGLNYYKDERRIIAPVDLVRQFSNAEYMEQRKREAIEEHFKVKFFTMLYTAALEGRQLSVPQVLEMQGEKASQMSTMVGRLVSEFFDPLIDRVWQIEYDAGRIPPPPPVLEGEDIEVDYLGPLAQAQKKVFRIQGIMQGAEMLKPFAETFPDVLDVVDPDVVASEILDATGFPAKAIRPPDRVAKIRAERARQIQEEKQAALALQAAQQMPNLSKRPEDGSPAEALTGGER